MTTTFIVDLDWDNNGTWTDESAYVQHVHIWAGFERPDAAVASVGRCTVVLDNSTRRFSPGNSGGALYGKLLPRKKIRVRARETISNTWELFYGWIDLIAPDAGEYGGGHCTLECIDGIGLLAQQKISEPYAASRSVVNAINDILSATYTPPSTDIHDNGDTLTHYGESWKPEQTTALDAIQQVCEAVYGRFFVQRNGQAVFLTRDDRQKVKAPPIVVVGIGGTLSLVNNDLDGLKIALDVDRVINKAQITVYPVETIAAAQVLWQARSVLRLAPGQVRTINVLFKDSYGERCGAWNVTALAAGTDYTVNDRADGTGSNYTSSPHFGISMSVDATRATINLSNTAIGPLYVTLLQVRGRPIQTYDPVVLESEDSASQTAYQIRALGLDLPMQRDENFAQSLAKYLIGQYKDPVMVADDIVVRGRDRVGSTSNLFACRIMSKVTVTDSESGLSAAAHWLRAVEYDIGAGTYSLRLFLERSDSTIYWLLEEVGFGELGQKTRLGI